MIIRSWEKKSHCLSIWQVLHSKVFLSVAVCISFIYTTLTPLSFLVTQKPLSWLLESAKKGKTHKKKRA